MVRFIHTADWHIGNPFSGFEEVKAERLRSVRFDTVERIFSYAAAEAIPLVLCAGDQLDSVGPGAREDLLKLFGRIRKYPSVTAVMIAGNHDPSGPGSPWQTVELSIIPSNVRIVRERELIDFPEYGLSVAAASLTSKSGRVNPLEACIGDTNEDTDRHTIRVGLAHGSLAIEGRHSPEDFPLPVDFADSVGIDYLALGHWHSRYVANQRTAYPGTPEPMAYDEEGGILEVTIDAPGAVPDIRPVDPAAFRWVNTRIVLGPSGGPVETVRMNLEKMLRKSDGVGDENGDDEGIETGTLLARLVLEGRIGAGDRGSIRDLVAAYADGFFRLDLIDRLQIMPTSAEIAEMGAEGYMGAVVKELLTLKEEEPDRTAAVQAALLRIYDFFNQRDGAVS
jgi:DNA repair exonuclease SbcCD nuclease subunit